MAHPKRAEFFSYLNGRLGDVPFSIDEGIGIWENCKRAWRLRDPEARWHVVIQDDAVVCDNFRERAEAVIAAAEARGDSAISFFFGKRKMMQAAAKRAMPHGFIESAWMHWGLAICLKADVIERALAFGDTQNIPQDDTRIANFLKKEKLTVYYPLPSLVDHREGESLVGDKGPARTAFAYIDRV